MDRLRSPTLMLLLGLLVAVKPLGAQWPNNRFELWASGNRPLSQPILSGDGQGGALIGGVVFAQDYDVILFRVDAQGQVIWNDTTAIEYVLPADQYPMGLAPDDQTGVLYLIADWPITPINGNRLLLLRFDWQGALLWQTVVRDSFPGIARDPLLTVTEGQAVVSWRDTGPNTTGIWYQRILISDGTKLNEPEGRFLTQAFFHHAVVSQPGLLAAADDSLYLISLTDGEISQAWGGLPFHQLKVLSYGDSFLVAGFRPTGELLLECFSQSGLSWFDTLATGLSYPVELNLLTYRQGALISYNRQGNLYFRLYSSAGLEAEQSICEASGIQAAHRAIVTDSLVSVIWYDPRAGHEVYLQQIEGNGNCRWTDGLRISSISSPSPLPPIDLCCGSCCGFMGWGAEQRFYFQLADSGVTSAVSAPPQPLASNFRLNEPYPNPFNGTVWLSFELDRPLNISLVIYNLLGQKVATLIDGFQPAGQHQRFWTPTSSSGCYLVRLTSTSSTATKKIFIAK